jgi:hypothetical protein
MATKITIVNEARYIDIVERALKDQNIEFEKSVKDNGLHVVFDVDGDFSFEGNFNPSWMLGFSKEVMPRPSVDSSKLKDKRAKTPAIYDPKEDAEMIADTNDHTVSGLIDE